MALPHRNLYPYSLCDEILEPRAMEIHIELMHPEIFQRGYITQKFSYELRAYLVFAWTSTDGGNGAARFRITS
jgi:hypothetical protein